MTATTAAATTTATTTACAPALPAMSRVGLFRRPSWVVAGAVVSIGLPPGSEVLGDGMQVTVGDAAGFVVVLVAAALVVAGRARMPRAALVAFGPVVVGLGISTVCSVDVASSVTGFVRNVQIFVLVPLAVVLLVRDRCDFAIVCSAVLAFGFWEAGYGIWQSVSGNGASMGGAYIRAVGTFGATNVMAMSVVVGVAFLVLMSFALFAFRRGVVAVVAVLGGLGVLGLALALSLSRGTWIALGAAGVLVLVLFDRWTAVKVLVCCAALGVVAVVGVGAGGGGQAVVERSRSMVGSVSSPDRSVDDRYNLWAAAVRIWEDHPGVGVGVKNFPAFRDAYSGIELSSGSETDDPVHGYVRQPLMSPHNQYLLFLAEQGVVGLAGLLGLLGVIVAGLWRRRAVRDPFWLASVGLVTFLLVNFLYADLGGPTCALTAIVLGVVASRAFGAVRE
ncbi:MAG: O-antigen ligase family protein [Spirillospora sp.]